MIFPVRSGTKGNAGVIVEFRFDIERCHRFLATTPVIVLDALETTTIRGLDNDPVFELAAARRIFVGSKFHSPGPIQYCRIVQTGCVKMMTQSQQPFRAAFAKTFSISVFFPVLPRAHLDFAEPNSPI